jgi:hypothetical protein
VLKLSLLYVAVKNFAKTSSLRMGVGANNKDIKKLGFSFFLLDRANTKDSKSLTFSFSCG